MVGSPGLALRSPAITTTAFGVGVLLCERDDFARLARVQHVVGLARSGTRRRVARPIVAAAREVRREEVDDAGGARRPHPQRGAERARQTEAAGADDGQRREHDLTIVARIGIAHEVVAARTDLRQARAQLLGDPWIHLLHADQLGTPGVIELLREELDPGRERAPVARGRARAAVQDVLGHDAQLRRGDPESLVSALLLHAAASSTNPTTSPAVRRIGPEPTRGGSCAVEAPGPPSGASLLAPRTPGVGTARRVARELHPECRPAGLGLWGGP